MKTNPIARADARARPSQSDARSEVAKKVGREILESQLDPAAWASALSESEGNRQLALSRYALIRIRSLEKQHCDRVAKIDSLESRRLKQCLTGRKNPRAIARSVHELLDGPRPRRQLNFLKPSLCPLWLAILWIGSTGTIATLGYLSVNFVPEGFAKHLTQISACCGLLVVGSALLLRQILPKTWILHGWNISLVAACNLVCLSSLFLGTKIIKRTMARDLTMPQVEHALTTNTRATMPTPSPSPVPLLVSTGIANGPATVEN